MTDLAVVLAVFGALTAGCYAATGDTDALIGGALAFALVVFLGALLRGHP